MLRTLAYTALCSAALIGSSAYAADNPATAGERAPTQASAGVNFVTSQEKTQWRAPKLVGVGVYGPDDKQIGKIDDLLVDQNGSAQTVVIGVGGFLGFGKKDVAVPFSAVQWQTEARKAPRWSRSASVFGGKSRSSWRHKRPAAANEGSGSGHGCSEPGLS